MMRTKANSLLSLFMCLVLSVLLVFPIPNAYATESTGASEVAESTGSETTAAPEESTTSKKLSEDDPIIQGYRDEIANLNKEIEDSKKKQEQIESEMAAASASAGALQEQIAAVQKQIDAHNEKIAVLNKQINALDAQINEINKNIEETQKKIEEQQIKIEETQKLLGERLRAMYMSGNVSTIEILLEADSFESLLNRMELVSQIAKHDSKIVEELTRQIEELEKMKVKLQEQMVKLEANKKEIEDSKAEVVAAKSEVNKVKSELDAKLNKLEKYLSSLDASNAELQAYQRSVEAQQAAYMDRIYMLINGIASTGDGSVEGGLSWPVPYANTYITSPFGYRNIGGGRSMHYGIDISMGGASDYNKRIVASANGKVLIANGMCRHNYPKSSNCGCNGGYGNYVVIDHGNGMVVYYAHLASVNVSVGQVVARGQSIGVLGCSGYSTGPHIHYEIRIGSGSRSNTAKNPINYLNVPADVTYR